MARSGSAILTVTIRTRPRANSLPQKEPKMASITYPCYYQYKDAKNEWRWTYYARNGRVISVSSESYQNRSDCAHAIGLMKGSASDAVYYEAAAA